MTLTMPALDQAKGQLNEKRKRLAAILAEAGPTLDMSLVKSLDGDSDAKAAAIRELNDEMTVDAKRVEELQGTYDIAKNHKGPEDPEDPDGTEPGEERDPEAKGRRAKSIGELIMASKAATEKGVEVELDYDVKTLLTTSAGWAPQAIRTDRLVDFATRPIKLLDMIPTTQTQMASVVYMEETTFTNAAAEVTEGSAKPEAALAFTERTSAVRKIAVWIPVTDEQLEDVPRMRGILNNRLPFMVRQRLASQILVGNGTAPNLRGLLNVAGIQTQPKGADPTPDAVYKAMVLVMTTGQADPDLVVFNPLDWQDVRLLRTADGLYIWGNPADAGPERIWGLTVALEQGLTQNTAVVGAFQEFAELAIRKGLVVEQGYQNDDFVKNLQTIRAEMRAAFVIGRPAAFCQVTGV